MKKLIFFIFSFLSINLSAETFNFFKIEKDKNINRYWKKVTSLKKDDCLYNILCYKGIDKELTKFTFQYSGQEKEIFFDLKEHNVYVPNFLGESFVITKPKENSVLLIFYKQKYLKKN